MTRLPIVAGNWKMNATLKEAEVLAQAVVQGINNLNRVRQSVRNSKNRVRQSVRVSDRGGPSVKPSRSRQGLKTSLEVALCPPFTALAKVKEILKGSQISLGAQDLHWESEGAFTGEISAPMLKDLGCRYVIVGHSERRHGLGETDGQVQRKIKAALAHGIRPILCVGETLELRQQGRTWEVVEGQLEKALEGVEASPLAEEVVIAYEPVWAIGTGQNATPAQAQEVQSSIRSWLAARIGSEKAQSVRIQYGGSVKPENARELMEQPDVDGALVGGASLDSEAFIAIVESAASAKHNLCSTG